MVQIAYELYHTVLCNLVAIIFIRRLAMFCVEDAGKESLISIQFFEPSPGADLGSARRLVCGGAAGITSVFFTYPLDIVRTRLSIQSASFAVLSQANKAKLPGMWATMVTMYRTEGGVLALYRGIIPTVAGVAPYVGPPHCSATSNHYAHLSIR